MYSEKTKKNDVGDSDKNTGSQAMQLEKEEVVGIVKGKSTGNQNDNCDCLNTSCPGCFFPCEKCGSNKCGHECRESAAWRKYEKLEN